MLTILALLVLTISPALAENIDPLEGNRRYCYGENIGWIDFEPNLIDPNVGATVTSDVVTGYVWSETVGWINLEPNVPNDSNYYGVTNNSSGKLNGHAWGESIGWINFNPEVPDDSNYYGVTIDDDGQFDGWAWGETIGWINFNSADLLGYGIKTSNVTAGQLHLVGPLPNQIPIEGTGEIIATVQRDFVGVGGSEVVFTKKSGAFTFTAGNVSLDGTEATVISDVNGIAEMSFSAVAEGPGLIEVSVKWTELSAFSVFNILPCELVANFDDDCDVDFGDFAVFALAWRSDNTPTSNWNPACDISVPADGVIDEKDLAVFSENWLEGK